MTRAEYFLELWHYWLKRLRLKEIPIRNDYRYHCHACVESWEDGKRELVYNSRRLRKWDKYLLINCCFHEIGHLKNDLPYDTEEEQVHSEYKAERYALTMMRKYYPKELKTVVHHVKTKNMNKSRWIKKNPIHYQAYLKIKEYN